MTGSRGFAGSLLSRSKFVSSPCRAAVTARLHVEAQQEAPVSPDPIHLAAPEPEVGATVLLAPHRRMKARRSVFVARHLPARALVSQKVHVKNTATPAWTEHRRLLVDFVFTNHIKCPGVQGLRQCSSTVWSGRRFGPAAKRPKNQASMNSSQLMPRRHAWCDVAHTGAITIDKLPIPARMPGGVHT